MGLVEPLKQKVQGLEEELRRLRLETASTAKAEEVQRMQAQLHVIAQKVKSERDVAAPTGEGQIRASWKGC